MTLSLVHTCVRVVDIDASVRFYELLGFERRGKLDFGVAFNIYMGLPGDGDKLELTIHNGDREKTVTVTLGKRPDSVEGSTPGE